jgi:altronate hydrolase
MKAIKINEKDNVAVALCLLAKEDTVNIMGTEIKLLEEIPQGHKFTVSPIEKGNDIIKYGFAIGNALETMAVGSWVHTHNLRTNLSDALNYEYKPVPTALSKDSLKNKHFQGYVRKDGRVAIRNEVWIIPTVGCVNNVATKLAANMQSYGKNKVDGVFAFPHPYGCSQMGEDQENTKKILADFINHPNAGAVLLLGLGCENSNIDTIMAVLGEYDDERVAFLECQSVQDEIQAGEKSLTKLIEYASQYKRGAVPISQLVIGLKCGGSDGLSGITANPLVGSFSDQLIAMGGSTILTEVPEMFGAETILMNRCKDKEIFYKMVTLINGFKDYYVKHDQVIYENPSPGNKKGGISSLEDKSLGCVQKGGTAPVMDILEYGDTVKTQGLSVLAAPGNDLVAATALAAAGAHMVLFTTGRGTPFGCPVPTVKISTNDVLATNKSNWIDFNAGGLATGKGMNDITDEFMEYLIKVASGEETKAEIQGYRDMAIFKSGVTL